MSTERFLPVLVLKSCENVLFYEGSFILDSTRLHEGLDDFHAIYQQREKK